MSTLDFNDDSRPSKRFRGDEYEDEERPNGHGERPLPPMSLSILGVEPLDEFIREIADFVYTLINEKPESLKGAIEVEARIGIIRDRNTGGRLALPVTCETVMNMGFSDMRFESNMSMAQHRHFNGLLNKLKMEPPPQAKSTIDYQHLYLVDSFYDTDGNDRNKTRVTRNEKTSEVVECIQKRKLGDLNIYSPKRASDWRVSVNVEVPVNHPLGSPVYSRKKDRLAYIHEEFNIGLTQVQTSARPGAAVETLHELEVEISRPDYLVAAAARRENPNVPEDERGAFDELIRAFVNNIRFLVRNTPVNDAWQ